MLCKSIDFLRDIFMKLLRSLPRVSLALVAALVGMQASAQSLTYAPATTSVPTLSEWGLLLTSLVLAVAAFVALRKQGSKTIASVAVVLAAAFGIAGGHKIMGEAQAVLAFSMSLDGGGTIDFSAATGSVDYRVSGHPTVPMRIASMDFTSLSTTSQPTCSVGLVLAAPGGVCYVRFNDPD